MGDETAQLEEYKTLRDETLRRIDARNQILSYTLAFAAAMFTLALGKDGFGAALLIYPVVAFFFATSFSFNSLMLIRIGGYIRTLEGKISGLGWAKYLAPVYSLAELFELTSTAGLFLGTELIGLALYQALPAAQQTAPAPLYGVAVAATVLTVAACFYPWFHHRQVMKAQP